jgi:PadR family transcriptional regulator PadR
LRVKVLPWNEERKHFREKLDKERRSGILALVLLVALDRTGPEYGYRLLKAIEERTQGRLVIKEGTAYPLLQKLERGGLASTYWSEASAGPPRKYYQITELGRQVAREASDDWRTLASSVSDFLDGFGR